MKENDLRREYEREQVNSEQIDKNIQHNWKGLKKYFENCIKELQGKSDEQSKVVQTLSDRLEQVCSLFLPSYTKADLLALKYQQLYRWGSRLIYCLAALAVITVSAQSLFKQIPHETILLEISSIAFIIFIVKYGNRIGWHRRWLDYRLLAERFRFAVFMAMVGEEVSTRFSQNDLNRIQNRDNWVFLFFREVWNQWEQIATPIMSNPASLEVLKKFIHNAWLDNQKRFHINNIKKHRLKHKRLSKTGEILFLLTLVAALLHFFHIGGDLLRPYWTFFAISFPATGLAFSALRAHFEHNKLVRRSEQMVKHIESIEERLARANNMDDLLQISREAEVLMLNENSDWHVIIGFHRLEPPG